MKIDKLIKIVLKNCGIQQDGSKKKTIKSKNIFGVESIFKTTQQIARYRIVALIPIGQLCMSAVESQFPNCVPLNKDFPGTNL